MKKLILLLLLTLPTTKYTACDNITTNLIALDQSLAKLKRTTKKLPKTPTKKSPTKKKPPKNLLEEIKKGKKLKQTIPTIESCTKKLKYTIEELTTDQKKTINEELQKVIKNLENTNDSLKRMLKMYQKMPYEKNREATWTYVITKLLENKKIAEKDSLKKEFEIIKKYRPLLASYTKDQLDQNSPGRYKLSKLPKKIQLTKLIDLDKETLQDSNKLQYTNFIKSDDDREGNEDIDKDYLKNKFGFK